MSKVVVREEDRDSFVDRAWDAMRGSANDLRAMGMTVIYHGDHVNEQGSRRTLWVVTCAGSDGCSFCYTQEGKTDAEALDKIRAKHAYRTDKLHHAPMCPANNYCGERAPTGPCTCGAEEMDRDEKGAGK